MVLRINIAKNLFYILFRNVKMCWLLVNYSI